MPHPTVRYYPHPVALEEERGSHSASWWRETAGAEADDIMKSRFVFFVSFLLDLGARESLFVIASHDGELSALDL